MCKRFQLITVVLIIGMMIGCGASSQSAEALNTQRVTPAVIVVTATPSSYVSPTPYPVPTLTPTPDHAIATLEALIFGCGSLSEYEQQRIYWSLIVAQDEAVRKADIEGRRNVDYISIDAAVMVYFSITAKTLECIKQKGANEDWPMP